MDIGVDGVCIEDLLFNELNGHIANGNDYDDEIEDVDNDG